MDEPAGTDAKSPKYRYARREIVNKWIRLVHWEDEMNLEDIVIDFSERIQRSIEIARNDPECSHLSEKKIEILAWACLALDLQETAQHIFNEVENADD